MFLDLETFGAVASLGSTLHVDQTDIVVDTVADTVVVVVVAVVVVVVLW